MAYTLGNKCAKNLCKRIVLFQLIIENVVTCFFLEHSVVSLFIVGLSMCLSCSLPLMTYSASNIAKTLKSRLWVTQGHWK